jgi:hypothetical protein
VDEESNRRPVRLVPLAPAAPARVPEQLDTLDGLAAGWLMHFGPNTCDAYARDLRSRLVWCDEVGVDPLHAGLHHADTYTRWLTEIATTRRGAARAVERQPAHVRPR